MPSDIPTTNIAEAVQHSLGELGVSDPSAVAELFSQLDQQLNGEMAPANTDETVEALRVRWLGRKQGIVRSITDNWLAKAPPELKREVGQKLNALRQRAEELINTGGSATTAQPRLAAEKVTSKPSVVSQQSENALDITLPGNRRAIGARHPLRIVMDDVAEIFFSLGYSVEEGPDVESTYYNFEALNIPEDHPARDDQDTFYIMQRRCCVPTLLLFRCGPWSGSNHRSGSSFRARHIATMRPTPHTHPCFIRWKASRWIRTSASRT